MATSLTEIDRVELAHVLMALFDDWKVGPAERVCLLGLPKNTKPRALTRYREGTPLPAEPELLSRAEHFLSIHSALFTTFPHNEAMARLWITTPNRLFNNVTPLQLMLEAGLDGIRQVRRHLDCTQNWF